jgi:inorganic pyrophosphatase
MNNLTRLPLHLDTAKRVCRAIIETPKGCRNKFRYDPEAGLFMLGGLLPEGMIFPFDFGFLPSTVGEDSDPLDILVMLEAPVQMGCLVDVRIIGIIMATQTENGMTRRNDRLLGVPVHSYAHAQLKSVTEISSNLIDQIEEFFVSYNKQRKKKFQIKGLGGPKKAMKFLKGGIRAFKKEMKDKDDQ